MTKVLNFPRRRRLLILAAAAAGLFGQVVAAQQLTGGERIYFDKGGCNQCHGSNGNGVGDDAREQGANLRETAMDAEAMRVVIACGLPGTNMPYFDKFAYTDDRCYGMTAEDVGEDKPQPPLANFLAKRDIDAVIAYIQESFVGKGPVDPETAREPAAGQTH